MSGDGSISLVWGDGENKFRFGIGQWRELQEKINARRLAIGLQPIGPMTLLTSLRANDAWPDDLRDILRIGLVGGGLPIKEAHNKLVTYFDNTPPYAHNIAAFAVLSAALIGVPDDPVDDVKKKEESGDDTPIKFSNLYGTGAAIGFPPSTVDEMSFWQLAACIKGYNKAQAGPEKVEPMSNEEFDAMLVRHNIIQ
jgi:hypothetical protein